VATETASDQNRSSAPKLGQSHESKSSNWVGGGCMSEFYTRVWRCRHPYISESGLSSQSLAPVLTTKPKNREIKCGKNINRIQSNWP